MAVPFIILLVLFSFHEAESFFLTNAEKELLYFSGFDHQQGLQRVEALCESMGASLVEEEDDITPLYDDLEINGPGIWLNRLEPWECGRRATCCGNYARKGRDWWSGHRLEIEKLECNVLGYTLCKIDHDISKTLNSTLR